MKQLVKNIILENQEFEISHILERQNVDVAFNTGLISTIIGSRRSGKTWLLYYIMAKLKKNGLSKEKIIFFNFEDERINFTSETIDLILQAYYELYPEHKISECYLFFDEIQNVKNWQKFIRRIFDFKTKNIFITGSNAKLLSSEIATELRGRSITYVVHPFSYSEFLEAHNVTVNLKTQTGRAMMINMSEKYLFEGGFPELTRVERTLKTKVLQQYFNVMIYRDIVERFNISNPEVLKYFIKKIFVSITSPLSVNKIYNDLKSMGYKISNKYLYEYLEHSYDVFLTQPVSKFSFSSIKQAKSDKKVYVIDNGLLAAIDFSISENRGKLFENMVVMEFIKQGKELFYYRDNYECDLIVRINAEIEPVQIAYSIIDKDTRNREVRGLIAACKFTNRQSGTIITFDEEDTIENDGTLIRVVPFYKYFTKKG